MGTSSLKVSPSKSGFNSNNKGKMNGYGNMYGAGYGDLSAYSSYGGMGTYGQPLDTTAAYGASPAAYGASPAALGAASNLASYGVQPGIGSYPQPPPPYQAATVAATAAPVTAQQMALASYQPQQQTAIPAADPSGAVRQQTTFSSLSPAEQDALLQQIGIDRSQVATNVPSQPAAAPTQQYQYVVAQPQHQPVSAVPVQQPIEQQQQYLPVPEAPPHYSNRYNQPREAQGQQAQVVYHQPAQAAHHLPQRQIQTPPPPQYVYERYTPPPPPPQREYSYPKRDCYDCQRRQNRPYQQHDRVYFPPREATIDEILDFLPPRPGVYQARPARQRLSPLSRELIYSKPRRVIEDDDCDGYVLESRYMKRRPSLSMRSKSYDYYPTHRSRTSRFYSDEDFYSEDYSDYSDY